MKWMRILAVGMLVMGLAGSAEAVLQSGARDPEAAGIGSSSASTDKPAAKKPTVRGRATVNFKVKPKNPPPASPSVMAQPSVLDERVALIQTTETHPLATVPEGKSPVVKQVKAEPTTNYTRPRAAYVVNPGHSSGPTRARIRSRSDSAT